jgi:hypothetical protein
MREPYGEGPASHTGPEPWAGVREGARQASVGARAGDVLSRESTGNGSADVVQTNGRQHRTQRHRELWTDSPRSKTISMYRATLRENRESLRRPVIGTTGSMGKS